MDPSQASRGIFLVTQLQVTLHKPSNKSHYLHTKGGKVCKDTQPFPSPFGPFYVRNDFFPNPLSHISLPKYAKGITQQMASYSMPPSFSNKRKYGNYVLRFINNEAIENLD